MIPVILILILIFIIIYNSIKPYIYESLEDYKTPLDYKKIPIFLKHPEHPDADPRYIDIITDNP